MTRFVLLAFLCLGASISWAADGMLEGGATVSFDKLYIHEDGDAEFTEPSTEDAQLQYFNFAHCTCAQSNKGTPIPGFNELEFQWLIKVDNPMNAVINTPLQLWTGVDCNDDLKRMDNCIQVGTT